MTRDGGDDREQWPSHSGEAQTAPQGRRAQADSAALPPARDGTRHEAATSYSDLQHPIQNVQGRKHQAPRQAPVGRKWKTQTKAFQPMDVLPETVEHETNVPHSRPASPQKAPARV